MALAVAALVIAALSLLVPSTPSYDPWSWLVWGREIIHLKLHTTGGPTWKPLPVVFTTVFALFGKAAPDLWLVVARAGGWLMAVAMVFIVAARLTRQIATGSPLGERAARLPAVLAGAIAVFMLFNASGFLSNTSLGLFRGPADGVRAHGRRPSPGRALPAGVCPRLRVRAGPPGDMALLGAVRPVAGMAGSRARASS